MVDINIQNCSFAGEGEFDDSDPGGSGGSGSGGNGECDENDPDCDDGGGGGTGGGDPPGCDDDNPCDAGFECINGECEEIPPECGPGNPCDAGFECIGGVCEEIPPECGPGNPCIEGFYCDAGVCIENGAPQITVLGDLEVSVEQGTAYLDAGAWAYDLEDGYIDVITTGDVNVFVVGSYTITYNATDSAGLSAETKTRTVSVVDPTGGTGDDPTWGVTPPVVILSVDDSNANPEFGGEGEMGGYSISLVVPHIPLADTDTQVAIVNVNDEPFQGDRVHGVISGELLNDPGWSWNITAKLKKLDHSVFQDVGYGNTLFRPELEIHFPISQNAINFYEANPGLLDSLSVTFEMGILYSLDFFGDGDSVYEEWGRIDTSVTIPLSIVVGNPDAIPPTLDYGNETVLIKYNVPLDQTESSMIQPTAWDLGNYAIDDVTIDLPADLVAAGFAQDDDPGGVFMTTWSQGGITSLSTPLFNLPEENIDGTPFTLGITVSLSPVSPYDGDDLDIVLDIPIIVEKFLEEDPVITLLGDSPAYVFMHDPWVDPGAIATDAEDGDLTDDIIVTGEVVTTQLGVYTLKYNVFDSVGHRAETVFRNVNVIPECGIGNLCDFGYLCIDGRCEPDPNHCSESVPCPPGYHCEDNLCVEDIPPDCTEGGDECPDTHHCENGTCVQNTGGQACTEGGDECYFGFHCENGVCVEDDPPIVLDPPVFTYTLSLGDPVLVQWGREFGAGPQHEEPETTYLVPTMWNMNGNNVVFDSIEYLTVDPHTCVGFSFWISCWPGEDDGSGYGPLSEHIQIDLDTGVVEFEPFNIFSNNNYPDQSDFPTNAEFNMIIHWSTNNIEGGNFTGTINVTKPVVYVDADSLELTVGPNGGGGAGARTVLNSSFGSKIKIPANLKQRRFNKPKRNIKQGNRVAPRRFSYTNKSSVLKPEVLARKRLRTSYTNGINDPNYTFFTNQTTTPAIKLNYDKQGDSSVTGVPSVRRPSVLGISIDETIAGIINVNSGISQLSDYYYNALTSKKVKNSFSTTVKKVLGSMSNLNGSPMIDSLASFVRKSIISNELGIFSENDILELHEENFNTTSIAKSSSPATNNKSALRMISNNLQSINPSDYNLKKKNRMIYWKPLAEDLDKRIIFETADGTPTNIYIPNNEKITVEYSTGKTTTLEMQDGDFFTVDTLENDNRLTVHSEIEKARIIAPEVVAQAARLAGDNYYSQLDVTSVTSNLVELNVDTTSTRKDYYFLELDKDSIVDDNLNLHSGDTLFTRKTRATYNYITTGIDDVVKHKAYPNLVLYLRNDDMFFNHLEASQQASLIHKDITLDNFENSLQDQILIRQLPQHILVIPSDRTVKVVSQERSKFINFNTRRIKIRFSPIQDYKKLPNGKPLYLRPVFTQTESLNFGMDIQDNVIWNEKIKFVFDTTAVMAIEKYKNGAEVLPRKETPMTKLLQALNNIKDVYSLTERDSINTFDLFSRMEPYDLKSLNFDVNGGYQLLSRLATNSITDDLSINESKFVKTKGIANIPVFKNPTTVVFLEPNEAAPQLVKKKRQTATRSDGAKTRQAVDATDRINK